MKPLEIRLTQLRTNIAKCAEKYHRNPDNISLLAVSKKHSVADIQTAIDSGQFDFGENYVQEAVEKIQALDGKNIVWHFIGPIQSNKTKLIAEHFSWVHSLDRFKIAERLNAYRPPALPPLNVCLQVNIDDEPQKAGVNVDKLNELVKQIESLKRLKLCGLMAIPKAKTSFQQQCESFARLHLAAKALHLSTLSMGMSGDYEAAIAEGATIIRVGTAIFGERD